MAFTNSWRSNSDTMSKEDSVAIPYSFPSSL
jgi:hypothetical protein